MMPTPTACPPAPPDRADLRSMQAHAQQAADLMQALSSPHRLLVLCALAEQELRVSDLNARLPLSQSALSQHLALLRKLGLVNTRRQSQTIYYSIADGPALAIIQLLHTHFCSSPNPPSDQGSSHV